MVTVSLDQTCKVRATLHEMPSNSVFEHWDKGVQVTGSRIGYSGMCIGFVLMFVQQFSGWLSKNCDEKPCMRALLVGTLILCMRGFSSRYLDNQPENCCTDLGEVNCMPTHESNSYSNWLIVSR